MSLRASLILCLCLGTGLLWLEQDRIHHPLPGIAAPEDPQQTDPDPGLAPWPVGDTAQATALASYRIHARVLSVKHYPYDPGAQIAPVDLALGWGRMSDWSVYDALSISQRGRFYIFEWGSGGPPIPKREIELHSANNHIIPADSTVRSALNGVQRNDLVWLEGNLVQVTGPHGFTWRSSLTREDTGDHSCELFRVTTLIVEPSDRHWSF